ncbi:NirD/YgiW/YdeI family stress tolerance protein [Marinomonas sp. A79]|uniref:NirD/YgiW/YdeI family stress tolerance protein n=1 Tax=Marinomonas vulgaris TaxID=2823372 RepID=A0ABS5HA36_9GAMM|nr:NirD/YgiW/YdeI family stress tolerance protein [Marinomonas vulgaris]MBR7888460.1 NirD/YgiW/YdeI family stress tolerance protein [Marinomonas vulgaris]
MKRILWVFLPLAFTLNQNSFAQYVGPNAVIKTDLTQILADPVDDEYVKLQGYLVKKLSSDKYLFSDGTKEIRVEIDQFLFPAQPFDDKDLIEIEGEVEKDFLESAEIDVDRLTIVNQ